MTAALRSATAWSPTVSRHGVDNFRLFFTVDIDVTSCVGGRSIKVKAGLTRQIDGSSSHSDITVLVDWIGIPLAYFNVEGSTVHGEENFILVGIGIGCIDTVIGCVDGDIPSVDGDRFSFETFG